jgi:hypothetical protein
VIGGTNQRRRFDPDESHLEGKLTEILKLLRSPVALHRDMASGRSQVLTHVEPPYSRFVEILDRLTDLILSFSQPEDEARLDSIRTDSTGGISQ